MDEREQLAVWTDFLDLLREAASLVCTLPMNEEVDAVLAEVQGWSDGWERAEQEPGERPLLFNRAFAHFVVLKGRVMGSQKPNTN